MRLRETLGNLVAGGVIQQEIADLRQGLTETSRELQRLKEDSYWTQMSADAAQTSESRETVRGLARQMFLQSDPFVKQSTLLMTYFCFGPGIEAPTSDDETTQNILEDFWNAPDNQQAMFGTLAQYRRSIQLLLDGDVFILVRPTPAHTVSVRPAKTSYVKTIVPDPLDGTRALYYKLELPEFQWDGDLGLVPQPEKRVLYYRDLLNQDPAQDELSGMVPAEEDVWMHHISINAIDDCDFGMSDAATSMSFLGEHKKLLEDQATISRVTAALAIRLHTLATAGEMATLRDSIEQKGQESTDNEFTAGAINLLGPGMDIDINRQTTRAYDAWQNSRMFRIAGAAGLGFSLHYLSDPENANLATATSMERPVLERLQGYQAVHVDCYRKLCDYALLAAGITDPKPYDIPAPTILQPDLDQVSKAVNDGYEQGVLTQRQAATRLLDALGFDDIEEELKLLEEETAEREEEEQTLLELAGGQEEKTSW